MAEHRPDVPVDIKRRLIAEAGNKCANPGCVAFRTHIHHIEEWAVYKAHDADDMIAVCPSCHDAIHHGPLAIDDEAVRRWKDIPRATGSIRDHVYVEPGPSSRLLLGSIMFESPGGTTIFDLGESNRLSFRVQEADVLLLGLAMSTTAGQEFLSVIDGHVRFAVAAPVEYQRIQGHVRVTAPVSAEYLPEWALQRLRAHEPDFAADGTLTLLDLEVIEPGLVRVQGVWSRADQAVAITPTALSFLQPQMAGPLSMVGHPDGTVIHVAAPITTATFGFGQDGDSVLKIPTPTPPKVGRNDRCWCGSGKKFKRCHGS